MLEAHSNSVTTQYAHQAERLGHLRPDQENDSTGSTRAAEALFVTPQDPIIKTANGGSLPAVPVEEAVRLNSLKDRMEGRDPKHGVPAKTGAREARDGTRHGARLSSGSSDRGRQSEASLRESVPQPRTHPLFPPLPTYGPPTLLRNLQCSVFRTTSFFLSLGFLVAIVLGAAVTSIPLMFNHIKLRLLFQNPDKRRPFFQEEEERRKARRKAEKEWSRDKKLVNTGASAPTEVEKQHIIEADEGEYVPTEGGPDPLICDVGYYARRVGLDVEYFDVQTEDGFIIELWHVYNPREYHRPSTSGLDSDESRAFQRKRKDSTFGETTRQFEDGNKRYPVLMMHGLLQSAGAYCCTEDDSMAFYLAKSGYDVWLGNNRSGFTPRHTMLDYGDPRMWAWNVRHMGVYDLYALVSRVLAETGFPKLGLVAHSQGTTQTLVALAKEQRPELGNKISVFCALAPAAYAGPLIGKAYLKFMRAVGPAAFRCIFGIHAFVPVMMFAHKVLPGRLYGAMGYRVFSFLLDWTDTRWEVDLRNRMFQFAPVYVSAESMRWWLGRECFAKQMCILATREEALMEDEEDEKEDQAVKDYYEGRQTDSELRSPQPDAPHVDGSADSSVSHECRSTPEERGKYAWYDDQFPPLALWVAGNDRLVDGRRLLRRFDRGREPHVNVVHKKIIEGYEHLDVIWAMDCIEKVGAEVKEVIWRTASEGSRKLCRVPTGCEDVSFLEEEKQMEAGGSGATNRKRSESAGINNPSSPVSATKIESTAGDWNDEMEKDAREKREHEKERRSLRSTDEAK